MTSPVEFTPAQPGTAEQAWLEALGNLDAIELALPAHLVVVSAHPDDETLGCGAFMAHAARAGVPVTVVLATWGEASHPASVTTTPAQLTQLRRREIRHALDVLGHNGIPIRMEPLDLPDGDLDAHHDRLTAAIVDEVGTRDTLILSPWRRDGHPDHAAAGRAAAAAAARTDSRFAEYPIWFWHWATPDQLPAARHLAFHQVGAETKVAKDVALAAHRSQTQPLSPASGDEPILPQHVLAHFRREREWFVCGSSPTDHDAFEPLHRTVTDPWCVDSPYEREKRDATLKMLRGLQPTRALEVGCSVGALTADLATVCGFVDALEPSPSARAVARRRTIDRPNVTVLAGAAPDDIPQRGYDLAVLSEVGYFLSPRQLTETVAALHNALISGGHLLACHWRHPIDGWPLDGPAVHRLIAAHSGFARVDTAPTDDYDLELWQAT